MRPTRLVLLVLLAAHLLPCLALAEPPALWGGLEAGPHAVGLRLFEEIDRSRAIRPNGASSSTQPRPIRVYVWYPASVPGKVMPMTFERLARMADDDVWPDSLLAGARERMAYAKRPFARSLGAERYAALLEHPVRAVENATPAAGTFPLIVVGQGLYYESPVSHAALSEFLASHGFVVATCPLVGTHSPLVHLDLIDLETQVRDMEFVIGRAREERFVSQEKLGLFGFDMGGMASVVLTMRNPDVDAFASVDAGILHPHPEAIPSRIPFASPHFDPPLLRAPWLHATQRRLATPLSGAEQTGLFDAAKHSDRHLILADEMRHADFTSYALVQNRDPMRGYWGPEKGGEKESYEVICRYVLAFFRSYLLGDEESRESLSQDPNEIAAGIPLTIEHRRSVPPAPLFSDLLNALLKGDVSAATEISAKTRDSRSDGPLHEESVLIRLGYHLLSSWDMANEGITVFRLNTELHPRSIDAWSSLGDGYLWIEDHPSAERTFRRVLELDPGNERAKRILARLQKTRPTR